MGNRSDVSVPGPQGLRPMDFRLAKTTARTVGQTVTADIYDKGNQQAANFTSVSVLCPMLLSSSVVEANTWFLVREAHNAWEGFLASGGQRQRFVIKSITDDYLVCHTWDGTTEGTVDEYVAKPPELRHSRTAWNGIAFTAYSLSLQKCTATKSSVVETWYVTPIYVVGDELTADGGISGGTGVTAAPYWQDQNRAGRAWAVE